MRAFPAFAAALLTVSLALAGCSGADGGSQSKSDSKGAGAGDRGVAGPGAVSDTDGAKQRVEGTEDVGKPPTETHVIRTATLAVEVKDVTRALARARSITRSVGGVVESETTDRLDDMYETSTVVLRVPEGEYDVVLHELAGTGKLLSRSAKAKDVTEQVVDVRSRIATQRASVDRLRTLMDRAEDITDVVALEGQLNDRQADLEALLARQKSLADRTAMATVTLDLTERAAEKKEEETGPGFLDALGGGWDAFVSVLRWIVVVVAAILPFVVALAVLYGLWLLLGARLFGLRRRTAVTGPATRTATEPATEPTTGPATEPATGPATDTTPGSPPSSTPDVATDPGTDPARETSASPGLVTRDERDRSA